MPNPIIAEVTRGGIAESRHRGAYAVVDRAGRIVSSAGDIDQPVYPRSAIKAFQCLPVVESGAADAFGFMEEEIALICSSHNGEPEHLRVARSILRKAGNAEVDYECGAHWPTEPEAHATAIRENAVPLPIHNNCSGKHAGMLALAKQLGVDPKNYIRRDHPVQRAIAKAMGSICDCNLDEVPCGIDGCSVPTWAMPLRNMALGFARLVSPDHKAGQRIIASVKAHPFMVAGTGRFDTELMTAVPRIFAKGGAEGVHCGAIPHAGLGIAVKCDDGAGRAAQTAMATVLLELDIWTAAERAALLLFTSFPLTNWRNFEVGTVSSRSCH